MTEIIVYTDGSSSVYPDKNGLRYGGVGIYFPEYKEWNVTEGYMGTADEVSNNTMELTACVEAIKTCIRNMTKKKKMWKLTIISDSNYSIKAVTEWSPKWILYGWKRKRGNKYVDPENLDVIKELYALSCMYPIEYKHVKSHKKEPTNKKSIKWKHWYGNKQADEMAKEGKDIALEDSQE